MNKSEPILRPCLYKIAHNARSSRRASDASSLQLWFNCAASGCDGYARQSPCSPTSCRQTAALKDELKWLTGELGPARELEVLVTGRRAGAAAALAPEGCL
jgi:hypothetical protein